MWPFKRKSSPIASVKKGDIIQIEWNRISGSIGSVVCMNNDPKSKKILLRVKWGNFKEKKINEYEQFICSYDDVRLKNFELLNTNLKVEPEPITIDELKKQLEEAVANEQYEKAREIQNKISKL